MTPSQQLGYKVGDKFIFTANAKNSPVGLIRECVGFGPEDVFTLTIDTGTTFPVFTGEGCTYHHGPDGTPGAHIALNLVTPYKE